MMDFELLKTLCGIHAPSGNEIKLKEFILQYIDSNASHWKVQPEVIHGELFQDSIILKFGEPRIAVFSHMDSIGFTVRNHDQLVAIGGPKAETGYRLIGEDSLGPIECELIETDGDLSYKFGRAIERGTELIYKRDFRETQIFVQSCYMDNRLGVWNALQLAETLENGILVFSC